MKNDIKKALDDLADIRPQINFDSEAARQQIADHIVKFLRKDKYIICERHLNQLKNQG
jgi:hypothetical protein